MTEEALMVRRIKKNKNFQDKNGKCSKELLYEKFLLTNNT